MIQQRFNSEMKVSWWGPIDSWIAEDIVNHPEYERILIEKGTCETDECPVIEVRKLMYALGMKPIKKEFWETTFRSL